MITIEIEPQSMVPNKNWLVLYCRQHMKRPLGVIVSACLQIVGSLVTFLLSALMVIVPLVARKLPENRPAPPPNAVFYGLAVFYLVLVVLGLATAVGLFRLKPWARLSTLVFAGALICFGLLSAAAFSFLPLMAPQSGPPSDSAAHIMRQVQFFFVTASLLLTALGGWWLYYFNRAPVSQRFCRLPSAALIGASETAQQRARPPVSIVVIACLSLLGGLSTFSVDLSWRMPAMFFLVLITGGAARAFYIALGLLHVYIGIGLLKLWSSARYLAIGLYIYASLNCLVCLLLPQRYLSQITGSPDIKGWMAQQIAATTMNPFLHSRILMGMMAVSLVFSLVMLYFLITRRAAFERAPATAAHV